MKLFSYTLLQKPSMTQAQNMWVTENSVIHIEWLEKSVINIDRTARSTWKTEFSFPHMF
jgi:hypothetical protein